MICKKIFFCSIQTRKKIKRCFYLTFKEIIQSKADYINTVFKTKYFIQIQSSNIPFIEGNEEFIFANLIYDNYDTYDTFIVKGNYPENSKDKYFDDSKYLSNIINKKLEKPIFAPINIMEKENKMKIEEKTGNKTDQKYLRNIKFNYMKYYSKVNLLKPILKIYCSDEFQNKHNELLNNYPEFNNNKIVKFIYEINIESLYYYCLNFNEEGKTHLIYNYAKIFYEFECEKIEILEQMNFMVWLKDMKGNYINLKDGIKNIDYILQIQENDYNIILYDYNLNLLIDSLIDLDDIPNEDKNKYIENRLNDTKYWTIQKYKS